MIMGIRHSFKRILFLALLLSFWQGLSQTPACTALSIPANGGNTIALDVNFEWVAAARAESYILIAGTSSGATDVLDNINVGNITEYDLANNLPAGQTIFVRIIPENTVGQNLNCAEISFTTTSIQLPNCVGLTVPVQGSVEVPIDTAIEWTAAPNATGYRITIGSSTGSTDIINDLDVGNVTSYQLPGGFTLSTSVFLKITPYNASGSNTSCSEINFTTTSTQVPDCVGLTVPVQGAVDVPFDTAIEWTAAPNATGYRITIGSSTGSTDITNDLDVGNVTSYQLPGGFTLLTSVFLKITPYNASGNNTSCSELQFTTTSAMVPRCTQIINPQDGDQLVAVNANITWIRDFTATGYLMTIRENEPDGEFILNEEDVGNGTNYKPPNYKPRTPYFVTMIPYNAQGNAVNCQAIVFTTGDPLPLPDCAAWIFPANGTSNVSPDAIFEWNDVPNTDGFLLTIGTSLNGTDILNNEDVGGSTSYGLSEDLPMGATIYVKVHTYKGDEVSETCPIISFSVEGPDPVELQDDIPKFFTPNNDGFNDIWAVISTENISVDKVYVYDRYGKLLKQLGEGQGWDGQFNGKNLPAATYWYSIELLNAPTLKGYFLLKR